MRVLISGGLGFIGRAITAELRGAGHTVRPMDCQEGDDSEGAEYIQGSVLNLEDCRAACEGIDTVIHSAAVHKASIVDSNPLAAIEVNVQGTNNLFSSAVAAGARRFIFMSSAKVYGDPNGLPSVESDTLEPLETYALSKVVGEYHCRLHQPDSGIEVVILRPFSVYGPGQELGSGYIGMVLSSLLGQRDVKLPGHSEFMRDFVHIEDVTRLSVATIMAEALPGVTVLNVGSGQMHSLRRLLGYASDIVGHDLPVGFRTPNCGTLTRSHACLQQASTLFDYRPVYDLRSGLAQTIEWFTSAGDRAKILGCE